VSRKLVCLKLTFSKTTLAFSSKVTLIKWHGALKVSPLKSVLPLKVAHSKLATPMKVASV
jgi:hypothetical protein